jgi:hypothetical protein
MIRQTVALAVLVLVFLPLSSSPQAQVSSSQPPSYSGALRPTPKSQGALYTVPVNFATAVDYNSGAYYGGSVLKVAVADLNGDGKPDLLVGSGCASNTSPCPADGVISVFLGNGDGTFQAAVTHDSGGYGAPAIAVADVNGDGKLDLLLANSCASSAVCTNGANGTVTVLLGNGDGTFQTPVAYNSGGEGADSIAVADVNGDGKPDLLVANGCASPCGGLGAAGSVGVLLGNGDGTFQTAVNYDSAGQGTNWIAVGDLRGNGKLDLAVVSCAPPTGNIPACNKEDGVASILLGNGDGTFQTAVPYDTGGAVPNSVAIADLNGDGKLDVVVSDACVGGNLCNTDGAAAVLLGNGDGTFQTAVTYDSGYGTAAIAVSDVNGDGKPDIVVATACTTLGGNCPTSLVGVLLGNGDGTFQAAVFFGSGGFTDSLAVADVNGDGKPDVLVGNPCATSTCHGEQSGVAVLINTTVSGPAAAISPTSLNFANQAAGVTSPSQVVTLTSTGTATLTINSVSFTGTNAADFTQTNNCGSSLAPGGSCQVNISFTPTGGPSRAATLQFTDNAPNSPQAVSLAGSVQDFSLAATSQTSLAVAPGQVANYAIAISPANGFAANVSLSCSGAPKLSTCEISPVSVTVNSAGATANVVVKTSGISAALAQPAGFAPAGGTGLALWLAISGVSGLVLLGSKVRRSRGRHNHLLYGLSVLCVFSVGIAWSACGNASSRSGGGTPPGTYNLTVTGTATSGSTTLTNTTQLILVVQ